MAGSVSANLNILDIISQYAPRQYKTHPSSQRGRYSMACPMPGHEGDREHHDHSGSVSVNADGTVFHCFGCGGKGNAYQLNKILGGWEITAQPAIGGSKPVVDDPGETVVEPPPEPNADGIAPFLAEPAWVAEALDKLAPTSAPPAQDDSSKEEKEPLQGVTINQLAAAKGLDPDFLRDTLGWEDCRYYDPNKIGGPGTIPAIKIPYPGELGSDTAVQTRYRVGLDKGERFKWKKGSRTGMYGLWALEWIREQGYVVVSEGETDYATLCYYSIPVLAVPGAATYKREYSKYFEGLQVYVWQEPGAAGSNLVTAVDASLPDMRAIQAPPGAKDPNELMQQAGAGFLDAFNDLWADAQPPVHPLAAFDDLEIRRYSLHDGIGNIFGNSCVKSLAERQEMGAKSWQEAGTKNGKVNGKMLDRADRLEKCFINWRRYKCRSLGEIMLRRNKCGDPACPYCTMWLLDSFFRDMMPVIEELKQPAIYNRDPGDAAAA